MATTKGTPRTTKSPASKPREEPADDGIGPIVILGAARSGTTYLTQLINHHPDVFISVEERLFLWMHQSLRVVPSNKHLFGAEQTLTPEFMSYLDRAYPAFIRDFYREVAPKARHWGDKYPHYAAPSSRQALETVAELFSDAKFIHIIRDGRDVVMSGLRGVWTNFDGVHKMWCEHVDTACEFGASLPPGKYFELKYEDLVRDDAAVAERIFEFLGIETAPAVLRFCERQQNERTPFRTPSRDLTQGADRSDWPGKMGPKQRQKSLDMLGEHLIKYGYETEDSLQALRATFAEQAKRQSRS